MYLSLHEIESIEVEQASMLTNSNVYCKSIIIKDSKGNLIQINLFAKEASNLNMIDKE